MTQATSVPDAGAPATTAPEVTSSSTAAAATTKADLPLRILRIVQFIFAVIVLGLTAYLVAAIRANSYYCYYTDYYDYDYNCVKIAVPGWISYAVFVSAFTTITHLYFIPASWVLRIYQPITAMAIDILSLLFWFTAFIVLAAFIGIITGGEGDDGLASLQILIAATVFAAVNWVAFIVSLVYTIKRRKQVAGAPSIATAPAPAMLQHYQQPQQAQQTPKYDQGGVAQHPGQV